MSDNTKQLMQNALREIQKLRAKVSELEQQEHTDIAIIGLGCQFPKGANNPEQFWQLLMDEVDAISDVPADRWNMSAYYDENPDAIGKIHTRKAGFLDGDIKAFDAQFFNMTPKEVMCLDPQQRLLLEVTFQALENANIAPDELHKTLTGVYVGMAAGDYAHKIITADPAYLNAYYETGNALSVAAGRLAYVLGLNGPAMVVDTACSSSLVATDLAVKALRAGECHQAIVGGVNAILSPENSIAFSTAHMLSKDGKCKTYADDADGYVRGEGCGVMLLKRLQDAQKDGDHIVAVIKGSAVNQDGASGGLTVPSGVAQQKVIKTALQDAGLKPEQVTYIETHGTGTSLGDPIEINALNAVFGANRSVDDPLKVASVKTNIGHLEAAAGIAGLIKTVLCLKHQYLPRHLHFDKPSSHIQWQSVAIRVNDSAQTWQGGMECLNAGVSSFGFSGTNAHIILQQYVAELITDEINVNYPVMLTLSAKSEMALQCLVDDYCQVLEREVDLSALLLASSVGRNHYAHRLAVVGDDKQALIAQLQSSVLKAPVQANQGIVFLFTGQGSQYSQMGLPFYQSYPVFRAAIDKCALIVNKQWSIALVDLLYDAQYAALINETQYTQVALFVTEYALAMLWKSWGLEPQAVAGHSIGEYVALCFAGVLSLEQSLKLVLLRANLMQSLVKNGAMAAVFSSAEELAKQLDAYSQLSIAAFNAPNLQVVSGERHQLNSFCHDLKEQGISSQILAVSHGFHSYLMEPILAEFIEAAQAMTFNRPQITLLSNVDGQVISEINAEYLAQQLREPVQFQAMLENFSALGYTHFLEIGAHNILTSFGQRITPEAHWVASLVKGQVAEQCIKKAIADLYMIGIDLDWRKFYGFTQRPDIALPTYPYQRKVYWITEAATSVSTIAHPTHQNKDKKMSIHHEASYLDAVKKIVKDITGTAIQDLVAEQNFLMMGLDSLLIVQLQQALERQFGVSIALNDFYQSMDSIAKITAYLGQLFPEETQDEMQQAVENEIGSCINKTTVNTDLTVLERVMSEQMQQMSALMEKQLQVLKNYQSETENTADVNTVKPTATIKKSSAGIAGLYKEMDTKKTRLSPEKQAYLDKLTQKFNQSTQKSKQYAQDCKKALAHNRTVAFRPEWKEVVYQIALQKAYGSKTTDIDGNEYIDITMGFGVNLFGHNPDFVKQALLEELQQDGLAIGPISRLAGDVAVLMQELTGLDRTAFFNTGSEAVMVALRLARGVTGRDKIVVFSGSYHGSFDGVLATGWYNEQGQHSFPLAPGTLQNFVNDVIVLPYGADESLRIIEQLGDSLAAVLVEPVQSRNPALQPKAFLQQLRKITEQHQTALIFDEMITGFRLHQGGAQAFYGVQADMATYGKVLGGGMPIGAVAGCNRFMNAIDGGYWQYGDDSLPTEKVVFVAGTFNLHPLAMRAAKAVLTHIKEQGVQLQDSLNQKTEQFCLALNAWFQQRKDPIELVYCGSLFRFQMQGDIELLNTHLLDEGILIWDGRNCFFSTAHTDEDIEQVSWAVKRSIEKMYQEGWLATEKENQPKAVLTTITAIDKQADYAVSNAQKRLWTLEQFDPELTAYNLPAAVILPKGVNVDAMHKAVQHLMRHHESLRTYFIEQDGVPRQKIAVVVPDVLEEISLNSQQEVYDYALKDAQTPFDLAHAPLIRMTLVHLPDCIWLLINLHHIIGDLWSLEVLADDLFTLYQAYQKGQENPLIPLDIHYKDYSQWQEQQTLQAHKKYWLDKMASAQRLDLPLDQPRTALKIYLGDFYRFGLTEQATLDFVTMCQQQGATVYMGITAVLNILLARMSGQEDIVIGSIFHGREHRDLINQIGFYVNTLPLRNQVQKTLTFSEFLAQVKQTVLDAGQYQAYPFDRLIEDLQVPRDLSRNPLFDVLLTMDDRSHIKKLAQQYDFEPIEIDPPGSLMDLLLYVNLAQDDLQIALNYNTDLYSLASIERFANELTQLMQQVSANPSMSLSSLL